MPADSDLLSAWTEYLDRKLDIDLVHDRPAWAERRREFVREINKLSYTGLLVPGVLGGLGFGAAELVGVFRQSGRNLLPVCLADALIGAPLVANHPDVQSDELRRVLESGGHVAVGSYSTDPWRSRVEEGRLSMSVLVTDADIAERIVVSTQCNGEPALVCVDPSDGGVSLESIESVDPLTAMFRVGLVDATFQVALTGTSASECLSTIQMLEQLASASESVGMMQSCVERATEYAKIRRQFGRPIGSFQAVQHILAACWRESYALDSICEAAGDYVDEGDPTAWEYVLAAQSYAQTVTVHVVEQTLQAQGAIAFTAEHPHQLFLKHALLMQTRHGRVSSLLDDLGQRAVSRIGEGDRKGQRGPSWTG